VGLQLIVQAEGEARIVELLGTAGPMTEVFHLAGELWGISIPTKVVDEFSESVIRQRLTTLNVYDLHEGHWRYA
jgi:hypothetical protein